MNVHSTILEKHGVQGGQVATVQGVYTYYHYMQVCCFTHNFLSWLQRYC